MFQSASPIDIALNIYDIHESNRVLYNLGVGFFHTGVEINGYEFSFSASGVVRTRPRLPEFGTFREQIRMGTYGEGMNGIYNIISVLRNAQFQPSAYHPINLNCNHFSDAFCMAAVNQHIPDYVNRMAGIGTNFSAPSSSASGPDMFAAPGVVKAPQQPTSSKTSLATNPGNMNIEQQQEVSIVSSVFGWFGWGSDTGGAAAKPAIVENRTATAAPTKKIAPSAKKELTEKQKELLAKMKS